MVENVEELPKFQSELDYIKTHLGENVSYVENKDVVSGDSSICAFDNTKLKTCRIFFTNDSSGCKIINSFVVLDMNFKIDIVKRRDYDTDVITPEEVRDNFLCEIISLMS